MFVFHFSSRACARCMMETNQLSYNRPDTTTCLLHPFFWNQGRRLSFLQDASDRFEIMCRDPRDPNLITLECGAVNIVGHDWHSRLDKVFIENLGKFRKNTLSRRECQSCPTIFTAPHSKVMRFGSRGSLHMISNRSEASWRNDNLRPWFQKKGWSKHVVVSGLLYE